MSDTFTIANCHHGWRGAPAERIRTPCPACGLASLFIGSGGHLTCSSVPSHGSDGCPSPSVEETVKRLNRQNEALTHKLQRARHLLQDYAPPKHGFPSWDAMIDTGWEDA